MPEDTATPEPVKSGERPMATDSGHMLTVHFDEGDDERITLVCLRGGSGRPCAVITCPIDHEDVSQECIKEHGAVALNKCWAVEWFDAGGRETLNTEALRPIWFPVRIDFDDGVVVDNAGFPQFVPDAAWAHKAHKAYPAEAR